MGGGWAARGCLDHRLRASGPSGSEATRHSERKPRPVPHSMCGSGARWCARADVIFDVPDMHVLDVEIDDQQRLVLTIESGQLEVACPACGVLAVGHGRRFRILHDAPCLGRVTILRRLVRMWRCREPLCPTTTFTESHDVAPPRMVPTTRAVAWATSALSYDDTTVSALARLRQRLQGMVESPI
jgi:transposase